MKSTHSECGSTHIVLIVVLVVAVLGLLGLVFWQNFMNQPAEQTDTNQSVTDESTDSNTPDPAASFDTPLTVEEWGVVGDVGDIGAVSYTIVQKDNIDFLRLSTEGIDCAGLGNGNDFVARATASTLVQFSDGKTAQEVFNDISTAKIQIGEYYYYYSNASGVCGEDGNPYTEEMQVLNDATQRFMETLVEKE